MSRIGFNRDWFGRSKDDDYTYDKDDRSMSWDRGRRSLSSYFFSGRGRKYSDNNVANAAKLVASMLKVMKVDRKNTKLVPQMKGTEPTQIVIPISMLKQEDGSYSDNIDDIDAFYGACLQNAAMKQFQNGADYYKSLEATHPQGKYRLKDFLFGIINTERVDKIMSQKYPGYLRFVRKYKKYKYEKNYQAIQPWATPRHRLFDLIVRMLRYPAHVTEGELEEFEQPLKHMQRLLDKFDGVPDSAYDCERMATSLANLIYKFTPEPPKPPKSEETEEQDEQDDREYNPIDPETESSKGRERKEDEEQEEDDSEQGEQDSDGSGESEEEEQEKDGSGEGDSEEDSEQEESESDEKEEEDSEKEDQDDDQEEGEDEQDEERSEDDEAEDEAEEDESEKDESEDEGEDSEEESDESEESDQEGDEKEEESDGDSDDDSEEDDSESDSEGEQQPEDLSKAQLDDLAKDFLDQILSESKIEDDPFEETNEEEAEANAFAEFEEDMMSEEEMIESTDDAAYSEHIYFDEVTHGNAERYQQIASRINLVKAAVLRKLFERKNKDYQFSLKSMRSGRLDTGKIAEAVQQVPTVYERIGQVQTDKLCVGVIIDESGSMGGDRISRAQEAAIFINEVFKNSKDVDLFIYGHTADIRPESEYDDTSMMVYREPGKVIHKYALSEVTARCQNRDGYAILACAKRMRSKTQRKGIIFVLSDGQPAASGYGGNKGIEDTRKKVLLAEKLGFQVIQIAIDRGVPSAKMFSKYVEMTDIDSLPTDLTMYLSKKVDKMIQERVTL